mmetsp:Transcript_15860/g.61968  ORF Transcript_15860/g.61968 Transcript_15860/m.61968 type:complete len:268 (-) Transcript_15860:114-917(-)
MLSHADGALGDVDEDIVEVLAVLHARVREACDVHLGLLEVLQLHLRGIDEGAKLVEVLPMPHEEGEAADGAEQCGHLVAVDEDALLHHQGSPQEDHLDAESTDDVLDGGGEVGVLGGIVVGVVFANAASGEHLEESLEDSEGRLGLLVDIAEEAREGSVALGVVLLAHQTDAERLHLAERAILLRLSAHVLLLVVAAEAACVDVDPAVLELAERERQRRLAQAQHRPRLQHARKRGVHARVAPGDHHVVGLVLFNDHHLDEGRAVAL